MTPKSTAKATVITVLRKSFFRLTGLALIFSFMKSTSTAPFSPSVSVLPVSRFFFSSCMDFSRMGAFCADLPMFQYTTPKGSHVVYCIL